MSKASRNTRRNRYKQEQKAQKRGKAREEKREELREQAGGQNKEGRRPQDVELNREKAGVKAGKRNSKKTEEKKRAGTGKQAGERKGIFFLNSTSSPLVWRTDCPFWERVSQCFSLVILTLFPLYIGSERYANITITKFHAFVALSCVYLVLCAVIAAMFPPGLPQGLTGGYYSGSPMTGKGSPGSGKGSPITGNGSPGADPFSPGKASSEKNQSGKARDEKYRYGKYRSGKNKGGWYRLLPLQRPVLPQIFLFAYMLWAVVCTLASPYDNLWIGHNRFEGLCSLLLYGAVFLLLSFWGEYTDAYFYGLAVSGAVLGLIALAQSFGSKLFYPEGYDYWNSQFLTTVGNIDCVAGYINILLPALLCAFVILKGKGRYLCLPVLFIMPYLAVFTEVDTAKVGCLAVLALLPCLIQDRERLSKLLVGLAPVLAGMAFCFSYQGLAADRHFAPGKTSGMLLLAAAVFLVLGVFLSFWKKEWQVKPSTVRRAGYAVLAISVMAGIAAVYGYSGTSRLLNEASQLLHGNLTDVAGSFRGYIWKSAAELIAERPVLGSGPGTFYTRFGPYNEGYRAVSGLSASVDFAHNDFLNIGVCTGLVGLLLYIAFLVSLVVRCARAAERCPVILILLAGILGYLLYSFFVFSIAIVSPVFWVMAGLADKCVRQAQA